MKNVLKNNLSLLLLPLLLPMIIVLLPIALMGHFLSKPSRKKRRKRLLEIIGTKWRRDEKYIYLCYSEDWNLASQLEQVIIPKYKSHMVIDSWSDAKNEWTNQYDDGENRVLSIVQEVFDDYDGDFDAYVGFIKTDSWEIDLDKTLSYMQSSKGYVIAGGEDVTVAEAIMEIDRAIHSHLNSVSSSAESS